MRTNRRSSALLVLFALVPSLFAQQTPKGILGEKASTALLQMNAAYMQTPTAQKSQALTQFRAMAAQRQQLLSSLIQTNPADVLRVAIPSDIRSTMPAMVQSYVEQTVQTQGVLEVLIEDSNSGAKVHYGLKTTSAKLSLHFTDTPPTNLLTGSIVRVKGVRVNNNLALSSSPNNTSGTSLQTVSAASAPSNAGSLNTLLILVNFQDAPTAQPWTPASVQNMVFTQTSNWDLENSFQRTWLTGDVAGWFTVPVSSTNCSTGTIKSAALSAAQAAGYILSNYSHFIYLMSSNSGCSSWWGLATIGGSDVWVNGQYNIAVHVFAHEMGHNLGLNHSHTVDCGTQVICSSGTLSEYGDGFDSMGASTYNGPHFNAFQKERLGWLNTSGQPPIATVTSSGTYQISPFEAQDSNPKALKILQSGSTGSYYYVEFRQARGFDSFLSSYSDVTNGLLLHLASPTNSNSSDLLDLTATSPASFSHPALVLGQSYTDSAVGVTITPTAVSSAGATVQVSYGPAACSNANPTVNITPLQSAYVTSGTTVNFTVTVKDNDNSGCMPATFNLADTLPSGWSGVWSTSALALSPGGNASATLTVTSPSGTSDGFYNVAVSVTNSGAPAFNSSGTGTYVISTPAPLNVSVTTNQASYSPGQVVVVTVSLLSGTAPDAGVSVGSTITPPSGKTTTQSGTTGSDGTFSFSYKLGKHAAVGTYSVQANTSRVGAAATMGASMMFLVQ